MARVQGSGNSNVEHSTVNSQHSSHSHAFTLIELLITTALTSVVAVVVAGAFAAGFRVWQRASQLGGNHADALIALEQIQKDVANTVPCRRVTFRGGGDWIESPSIVAVPALKGAQDQPGVIRLEFNAAARRLDRVVRIFPFPDPEREIRETLVDGVETVKITYGDRGSGGKGALSWAGSWTGPTNPPVAITMTLRVKQGGERFDLSRTIPIPCH